MPVSYDFTGKVALITGSSSGIGAATAVLLAKSGANVVITGRNAENVSKVSKQCSDVSPKRLKPLEVVADVTKEEHLRRLLDTTIKTFGKLDILVNNAGFGNVTKITESDYMQKFKEIFQTNLNSVVYLTHKSVEYLEKTKGNIINISSIAGMRNAKNMSVYSMSKTALDMFAKCMAAELGPKHIRVNSVNPGAVRTNIIRDSGLSDEVMNQMWDSFGTKYPVGRIGEGVDIANAVAYLASDHASFVTGALLVADGGHLVANVNIDLD